MSALPGRPSILEMNYYTERPVVVDVNCLPEEPIYIEMTEHGPQGIPGDVYFPAVFIDFETGHMIIKAFTGHYDPEFILNQTNGHLEVVLP